MTREQKEHILRGLPKNSPVKYIGVDIKDYQGQKVILKKNSTGFKIRNGRHRNNTMIVSISGGKFWRLPLAELTCKAIEVAERLEQSTQTPSK